MNWVDYGKMHKKEKCRIGSSDKREDAYTFSETSSFSKK